MIKQVLIVSVCGMLLCGALLIAGYSKIISISAGIGLVILFVGYKYKVLIDSENLQKNAMKLEKERQQRMLLAEQLKEKAYSVYSDCYYNEANTSAIVSSQYEGYKIIELLNSEISKCVEVDTLLKSVVKEISEKEKNGNEISEVQ